MLKNHIKIAWRNLIGTPSFSLIKIIGLSAGIASVMLILFHVKDELSYDKGFTKSDRIFRVTNENLGEGARHWAATPFPMGLELQEQIPEIESIVRLHRPFPYQLLQYSSVDGKSVQFEENDGFFSDPSIVDVFALQFSKGNPQTALNETNTIVLSQSMAERYFGDENPLGKNIFDVNENQIFKVTGVLKDMSFHSHLKFDYLISMPTITYYQDQKSLLSRGWSGFYTYALLNNDKQLAEVRSKMDAFMIQFYKPKGETPDEILRLRKLHLQPITDIHLHSKLEKEMYPNSDITYVYIFSIIALFIMLLAAVNFINISNTQSFDRVKEIGVRKVVGALRKDVIQQFLVESMLAVFISIVVALLLFAIAMPYYAELTNKSFSYEALITFLNFGILVLMLLVIGLFSGLYPAFFVSKFNLISSLKGKSNSGSNMRLVRNSLIVFQFVISVFMIIGTVVIYYQMDFFHNKDLGFDKEQLVVVKMYPDMKKQSKALFNELQKSNGIESFATVSNEPGKRFPSFKCLPTSKSSNSKGFESRLLEADEKLISTLNLSLESGQNFFKGTNNKEGFDVILNESASKVSGYTDPIGKEILVMGMKAIIIGIVKDFNFASLHAPIEPLTIVKTRNASNQLLIKIRKNQIPSTLVSIEACVKKVSPSSIFTFSFVDDQLNKLYNVETKMRKVFNVFAILSILISCLGLYSLSAYSARIRVKEIGVRKVLGSSTLNVAKLLSKDFLKLVLIALCIAIPLAYVVMHKWLQSFNYHIDMSWWMFGLSAIMVLFIAIATLSYQSIKAASVNPIKSLRTS